MSWSASKWSCCEKMCRTRSRCWSVKRCGFGRLFRYSRNLFSGVCATGTAGSATAKLLAKGPNEKTGRGVMQLHRPSILCTPIGVCPDQDSCCLVSIQSLAGLPTDRAQGPDVRSGGRNCILRAIVALQQPCQCGIEFLGCLVSSSFDFPANASD